MVEFLDLANRTTDWVCLHIDSCNLIIMMSSMDASFSSF